MTIAHSKKGVKNGWLELEKMVMFCVGYAVDIVPMFLCNFNGIVGQ
jgi:hypothetical protein